MPLFNFSKKNKKAKSPACSCNNSSYTNISAEKQASVSGSYHSVKVLGTGCASCHALLENTKSALKNKGIAIEAEYISDMSKIMEYGVMSLPALVVNEKVVSMGRVLKTADVEKLLVKPGV